MCPWSCIGGQGGGGGGGGMDIYVRWGHSVFLKLHRRWGGVGECYDVRYHLE